MATTRVFGRAAGIGNLTRITRIPDVRLGDAGAEAVHQVHEAGKAGVDETRVVHRDRLGRGNAEHQEAHGDAMVHGSGDGGASWGNAGSVDGQAVGTGFDTDSAGVQTVG